VGRGWRPGNTVRIRLEAPGPGNASAREVASALVTGTTGALAVSDLVCVMRAGKIALVPFDAPWLHMSYGLFYPRKRSLSRAAQLFVTQLRQVETALQVREQRAVARMNLTGRSKGKARKSAAKTGRAGARTTRRRKTATRGR
jgi:hypothetical protein